MGGNCACREWKKEAERELTCEGAEVGIAEQARGHGPGEVKAAK